MSERNRKLLAYAALYLIWGSTYLAMRIALETLPAYELASVRFLAAGAILIAVAKARDEPWPNAREWLRSGVVGVFLLVGGNTAVLWALKSVPSGIAALLVSTTPFWLALLSRTITRRSALGIALGLLGIAILMGFVGPGAAHAFAHAGSVNAMGALVLVCGSLSWAIGSLIQRGSKASALMATGAPMLIGGAILFALAYATGELHGPADGSTRSWLAVLYLGMFGSLIGFTCYAWLMAHDPPARVATYAYVNPIVAVALGALVGGETISSRVVVAGAVIIAGVIVIVRAKK